MSDETKQVLEAAIEAHFANECDGAMVGGYMLQVFGSTVDDINDAGIRMLGEVPDTQNIVTTMGLADYARENFRDRVFNWGDNAGGDD